LAQVCAQAILAQSAARWPAPSQQHIAAHHRLLSMATATGALESTKLPPVNNAAPGVEFRSPRADGGCSVGTRAAQRVRQKSAGLAAKIRKDRDDIKNQILMKGEAPGGTPRVASKVERDQIATMLNQRMIEIFIDPQARSWYKLFCHMDDDLSGKVSFNEFEDMIRNELHVSKEKVSEDMLKAVWRALDEDNSGQISCGEFGHFMRQGGHVHSGEESAKARMLKTKKAEVLEVRNDQLSARSNVMQARAALVAMRHSKAAEMHNSTWGMSPPPAQALWRGPNALVY